ncbi:MAG: sigma-54 dependent transcriptional regulator [Thiothrix sp.]|uniref:sigma-54 interaction domain-containing protein n=1 Tax=Thiothrix sp. TaxID=1032 RepID=UPI0026291D2A|nr:sigma-54 dependent transcriptional regulator [Thiothrix sp.]MDD5391953.1 sigma-54 dependent transcriptional regulator [Thiothrix sp.]
MESDNLSSQSPAMNATLQTAMHVARTNACVLILGESGTGKERVAHAIHAASQRSEKPLIIVNCTTLPSTLAESLLFGHVNGAFTGADYDQPGMVASADGGTLFLDEIGELPLTLQPKLLRFLESGEFLPLGKSRPRRANVRILAATHRDLRAMAAEGKFRNDLFYRLNVVPIELPALRERKEDIPALAEHFLHRFSQQHKRATAKMGKAAQAILLNYAWPGNVRELRNLCEHLSILSSGCEITPLDLPARIHTPQEPEKTSNLFTLPDNGINLDEMERCLLSQALERARYNKTRAARLLGISRDAMNYRLKKNTL